MYRKEFVEICSVHSGGIYPIKKTMEAGMPFFLPEGTDPGNPDFAEQIEALSAHIGIDLPPNYMGRPAELDAAPTSGF
ncbi:hypothetical protein [Rhizobium sp. MHM7A]|uniref:hypothetical protein n=1 Tax=Rhizobium sp. MHM7A TaxID=2583233 RepID=UPI001105B276|nr:hypothetical protein [Rhizobium sp. MHM7A]TLX15796.1 hypothetical protein FFR93_00320 [Rhizobium sp. MHM7A]